jgi:hypothetical protein
MKKILMLAAIMLAVMTTETRAQAKFCKSLSEFQAGQWTAVSSLVKEGGKGHECKIEFSDNEFKFKTGDNNADKTLRKDVLVVNYDGHLYANCRHLSCGEFSLDANNYAQAYRFGGDKLLIVAYHINDGTFLASLAGDIAGIATPGVGGLAASVASNVIWYSSKDLKAFRCYLLEKTDENEGTVQGLNDEYMEKLLADSPTLLKSYKSAEKKNFRLSATHILPILQDKGLLKD